LGQGLGIRAEEAARIYGEILERLMFRHSLEELSRVVSPRVAAGLLYRIVRSSMKEAVEEVLPGSSVANPMDAMMLCYRLFEAAGQPFEHEVEAGHAFRVARCPHYRFTRDNPLACVACAATKAGALEALTGKSVAVKLEDGTWLGPRSAEIVVERTHHMPRGDPYCRFVLHVAGADA